MPDSARKGRAPDSSNWEAVARLLSRKHDRIDSLHALDLLPGEVRPYAVWACILASVPGLVTACVMK